VFTLETKVAMNPPPVDPELESQRKNPQRFTYASGSRPLDGYQIKRGVGRGGFGEVYFAVSDAGKEVALKLIRRNLDVELRGVTQCLNLKHQNLVALYDIRTDEHNDRWVVMEYVSGESLEDAIHRHPDGMPIELAMGWFTGIAAGVAYLHDHGIVHRDLKPANIFIDEGFIDQGVVKIGDYGLSKFISCSRRSGQTESVGTVHYMAPEIANGRYGKEIDTYALGIILHEMLTGHVPFEGESIGEVLMKHLTAEPDLSLLDEPYRELVRSAMTKDPDLRIQSVAEMLGRLPGVHRLPEANGLPNAQQARRFPTAAEGASPQIANASEVPLVADSTSNEEPILASLRAGWRNAEQRFHNSNFHPFVKAILSVAAIGLLILSSELWLLALFVLGFSYFLYRAVRAIVVRPDKAIAIPVATSAPATPLHPAGGVSSPSAMESDLPAVKQTKRQYAFRRHSWRQRLHQHVAAKPLRAKATELIGSMIVAALISSLLAVLGVAIVGNHFSLDLTLWMAIVATLGSWAVMIPNKLAEGRIEDQAPLRFGLLIAGALVGIVACGTAQMLDLELPVSKAIGIRPWDTLASDFLGVQANSALSQAFRSGYVPLSLPTAIAYFAFLLVILRWWRQAEYARRVRVSVWSILACTFSAFLMTFVWWFPQPLGAVLAGMIAFATQLSSPWMPPSKRRELAEQGVQS